MIAKELFEKLEDLKKQIEPSSTFRPFDLFPEAHGWMIKLEHIDISVFQNIIHDGLALVSQTFDIPYDEAKKLIFGTKDYDYNKEQAPIVILFYLYLDQKRKDLN